MRIVLLTLVVLLSQAVPSFAKCKLKDICTMMQKMDHFSVLNACPGSAPLLKQCKKVNEVGLPKLPTPEFVDNGDGTITDKVNKLRWLKKGIDKRLSLKDAYGYASSESFAGSSEWRLPTYLNSDHFFPLKKLSMQAVKNLGSTLSSIIIGLIIFGLPPPVIKFHT